MRKRETEADRFVRNLAAGYAIFSMSMLVAFAPVFQKPVYAAEVEAIDGIEQMQEIVEAEEEWTSLGTFKLTYYCPCRTCNGKYAGKTASGAVPTQGRTIAVDRRVIPLGTEVMIDGHRYVAEDTGVRGNHIDIFLDSHKECLREGVKRREVFILRKDRK